MGKSAASEQLARVMLARGLSQDDIADATGAARQAIGAYLAGKYQPGKDVQLRMRDLYGISADAWLDAPQKRAAGKR
jgi:transcriptional regulator with XRE-family HTH domain